MAQYSSHYQQNEAQISKHARRGGKSNGTHRRNNWRNTKNSMNSNSRNRTHCNTGNSVNSAILNPAQQMVTSKKNSTRINHDADFPVSSNQVQHQRRVNSPRNSRWIKSSRATATKNTSSGMTNPSRPTKPPKTSLKMFSTPPNTRTSQKLRVNPNMETTAAEVKRSFSNIARQSGNGNKSMSEVRIKLIPRTEIHNRKQTPMFVTKPNNVRGQTNLLVRESGYLNPQEAMELTKQNRKVLQENVELRSQLCLRQGEITRLQAKLERVEIESKENQDKLLFFKELFDQSYKTLHSIRDSENNILKFIKEHRGEQCKDSIQQDVQDGYVFHRHDHMSEFQLFV